MSVEGRFAELRRQAGVSAEDLANELGIDVEDLLMLEQGHMTMVAHDILRAVYILGGSADWVMFNRVNDPSSSRHPSLRAPEESVEEDCSAA